MRVFFTKVMKNKGCQALEVLPHTQNTKSSIQTKFCLAEKLYTIWKSLNISKVMQKKKNRSSSLMTLVYTEQMKIWSWLHSETRTISFVCCQLFYDCLLSYKRHVNNSGLDETDWSRYYFIFFSCSWLQIIHYFTKSFQIVAFFIKGCSEQHSKQSFNAARNLRCSSNFMHFQLNIHMETICTSQYIFSVEKHIIDKKFHWLPFSIVKSLILY